MRWNTPLSETHAELLLERLDPEKGAQVLDLGCGWGELLMRAVARAPGSTGTGVDTSEYALTRGRTSAARRGLSERVTFVAQDARTWTSGADLVLCVGASHAWGSSAQALRGLAANVRTGGRLLFGDGFWERRPSAQAVEMFGEGIPTLATIAGEAIDCGWQVIHLSTADQREWDDFESTWRAGREHWLLSHPDDPRAGDTRAKVQDRMREYLDVYRGVLGFAYLVLARPPGSEGTRGG